MTVFFLNLILKFANTYILYQDRKSLIVSINNVVLTDWVDQAKAKKIIIKLV